MYSSTANTANTANTTTSITNTTTSNIISDKLLVVSILGPPNAGKSTLFNRLLDKAANRAYKLGSEKGRKKYSGVSLLNTEQYNSLLLPRT